MIDPTFYAQVISDHVLLRQFLEREQKLAMAAMAQDGIDLLIQMQGHISALNKNNVRLKSKLRKAGIPVDLDVHVVE